MRNNKE